MEKSAIKTLLSRYAQAKTARQAWNNTFSEVARYVWPDACSVVRSVPDESAEGRVLTVDISDSTAIKASVRMTSGIFGWMMPMGTKWFEFRPAKEQDANSRDVQRRLAAASQVLHSEIWRSNFQREMFNTIRSMVVFGTGAISVEWLDDGLLFRSYPIGNIFFEEDSKGRIDTVFRREFFTLRQMAQEFGADMLPPDKQRRLADTPDDNAKYEVVHCVFPRTDYDITKVDAKGQRFASVWLDAEAEAVLRKGGFDSMPYRIGRFDRSPTELMGRSPAIELLPDIKMLNSMRRTFVMSCELQSCPALIVEDDSVIGQPSTGPGDIIVKRHGADDPRPLQTGANPQLTAEAIAVEREGIMQGFFMDMFDVLERYRNMTAYEVSRRIEDKQVLIAPMISGLQKEMLDPLILRSLDLISSKKRLAEPVSSEDGLQIVYQGRLSLAMSNLQASAIELTLAKWSPYQAMYPVLDNVNLDKSFVMSALNAGVPADCLRSQRELEQIRQQAQQAQQAQQTVELAEKGSKAIRNLSGTSLEGLVL